jgi:hypothetical protein
LHVLRRRLERADRMRPARPDRVRRRT